MATWGVFDGFKGGYDIRSHDNGSLVLHVGDNLEIARQIVHEHNAHGRLVKSLKDVMARICDWCAECDDIGESANPCKCISEARALLDYAKGMEKCPDW